LGAMSTGGVLSCYNVTSSATNGLTATMQFYGVISLDL
jgi:hypothetical protein